jgi:hypothetical protein
MVAKTRHNALAILLVAPAVTAPCKFTRCPAVRVCDTRGLHAAAAGDSGSGPRGPGGGGERLFPGGRRARRGRRRPAIPVEAGHHLAAELPGARHRCARVRTHGRVLQRRAAVHQGLRRRRTRARVRGLRRRCERHRRDGPRRRVLLEGQDQLGVVLLGGAFRTHGAGDERLALLRRWSRPVARGLCPLRLDPGALRQFRLPDGRLVPQGDFDSTGQRNALARVSAGL